jgi:hypothetical protein
MTDAEQDLLRSFLSVTGHYLEFGAGASTVMALDCCKAITAVDSSPKWIRHVQRVADSHASCDFQGIHADLGRVKLWGYPVSHNQDSGRIYSSAANSFVPNADFVLIDGRFRVACFAKLAQLGFRGPVAIHDYSNRPWYHTIDRLGRRIAQAETLSVFVPQNNEEAASIWEQHLNDPR